MDLQVFRNEAKAYIEEHCPDSMRNKAVHFEDAFEIYNTADADKWRDAMAERGLTAPTWPREYGGGGLSFEENQVLQQEMAAAKALPPSAGMGLAMIGPTLLEFGTEEQKKRHLPKIASGEVRWCQGQTKRWEEPFFRR